MPKFYRNRMSATLASFVEEHMQMSPEEQINLFEELALTRTVAGDAVALYDATVTALKEKNDDAANQTRLLAGSMLKDALKDVSDMCMRASAIEQNARDKFSVHTLQYIINQIVRIVHEACEPEHHEVAERIEYMIHTMIRIPKTTTDGTELTPDQDARDMDATVPNA